MAGHTCAPRSEDGGRLRMQPGCLHFWKRLPAYLLLRRTQKLPASVPACPPLLVSFSHPFTPGQWQASGHKVPRGCDRGPRELRKPRQRRPQEGLASRQPWPAVSEGSVPAPPFRKASACGERNTDQLGSEMVKLGLEALTSLTRSLAPETLLRMNSISTS